MRQAVTRDVEVLFARMRGAPKRLARFRVDVDSVRLHADVGEIALGVAARVHIAVHSGDAICHGRVRGAEGELGASGAAGHILCAGSTSRAFAHALVVGNEVLVWEVALIPGRDAGGHERHRRHNFARVHHLLATHSFRGAIQQSWCHFGGLFCLFCDFMSGPPGKRHPAILTSKVHQSDAQSAEAL